MGNNGNLIQLQGKRFGALVVLRRAGRIGNRPTWHCRCDCGKECVVLGVKLRQGTKKSCGQGHYYKMPLIQVSKIEKICYDQMLRRCYDKKNASYANYGGRGIRVCRAWRLSFQQFLADVGPRPSSQHSLDRFPDWDGDYEPDNVRWATRKEQGRNKRNTVRVMWDGRLITVADYAERVGINSQMVRRRLARGWTVEEALLAPKTTDPA
jgi:hypothetical protein